MYILDYTISKKNVYLKKSASKSYSIVDSRETNFFHELNFTNGTEKIYKVPFANFNIEFSVICFKYVDMFH